jgi:radical SAM protein with 4Fe4S-binding SPASM domain
MIALTDVRQFIGSFSVEFIGGEPFVFKPFLSLTEWCTASGIRWSVTTNGSALSAKNAERLIAARPLFVNISVDGATAAVHDHSRGVRGSLETITRGIGTLRTLRERSGQSFPIRIKPTVHRGNFREMPDLVRWAERVGATSIDFSPVRHWTPEVVTQLWIRRTDEADLRGVIETLIAMKRAGAAIETEELRLASWIGHFRGERIDVSLAPCRVGLRDYFILPNGDVRSCWFYPVLGNVKEASAREIWRSAAASELRAQMTQCPHFGSVRCAASCLAHRTLREDARRALMVFKPRAFPAPDTAPTVTEESLSVHLTP